MKYLFKKHGLVLSNIRKILLIVIPISFVVTYYANEFIPKKHQRFAASSMVVLYENESDGGNYIRFPIFWENFLDDIKNQEGLVLEKKKRNKFQFTWLANSLEEVIADQKKTLDEILIFIANKNKSVREDKLKRWSFVVDKIAKGATEHPLFVREDIKKEVLSRALFNLLISEVDTGRKWEVSVTSIKKPRSVPNSNLRKIILLGVFLGTLFWGAILGLLVAYVFERQHAKLK